MASAPLRRSPLTGSNRHIRSASVSAGAASAADAYPELAKCSREQLIEMVGRGRVELGEVMEKAERAEESVGKLVGENEKLGREVEVARGRMGDVLNEQGRMEEELAGRIEVLDKLRSSVRELEREKRDAEKRYRDQGESFDAERQSWYDQERHYKLRISNLSSNRKAKQSFEPTKDDKDTANDSDASETPSRPSHRTSSPSPHAVPRSSNASPSPSGAPSATEVALQDQLSSLTTAHSSLTATMRTLQVELSELKRVYQDLQEENESYEILLGEKTLNGEVRDTDFFRRSSLWGDELVPAHSELEPVGELHESGGEEDEEEDEDEDEEDEDEGEVDVDAFLLESQGTGSFNSGAVAAGPPSGGKRKRPIAKSNGGGLDLAAELEAAQIADQEEKEPERKKKQTKKEKGLVAEIDELKSEVKQLREANKALTLYVSKIVDRVCSQEGFEKVLAVDYRLATPKTGSESPDPTTKPGFNPAQPPATTFRDSYSLKRRNTNPLPMTAPVVVTPRRGILGWDSLSSVFSSAGRSQSTAPVAPALKPFVLSSDGSARKLEVEEDEDDIRERERLRAEMALHGIADSGNAWGSRPASQRTTSTGGLSPQPNDGLASPTEPTLSGPDQRLDLDVLSQSSPMAAQHFRSIEEKEKALKSELDQGRASGFTEPKPRRQRPGSSRSTASSRSSRGPESTSIGLGISDGASGRLTPDGSPSMSSPATSASPESSMKGDPDETDASWSKRLKRISLTAWTGTSPNPATPTA